MIGTLGSILWGSCFLIKQSDSVPKAQDAAFGTSTSILKNPDSIP
jgi:hypothetical protein